MPPPKATPPDDLAHEYSFDRYGVRIPALLVSPWVGKGVCEQEEELSDLQESIIQLSRLAKERMRRVAGIAAVTP